MIGRLAIGLAAAFAVLLLLPTRESEPARRQSDDPVVVRTVPGLAATPLPQPRQPVPGGAATSDAPTAGEHDRILRALRLLPGAALHNAVVVDAGQRVVCGTVVAAPAAPSRRFVYLGAAGLGAIDDGQAEFDRLAARVCRR